MSEFNYQRYLASREWALLKEQVRERSGGFCERCAVNSYESTHHVTYERIGREKPEDLLAVCNECHEYLSGKTNYDPAADVIIMAVAITRKAFHGNGRKLMEGLSDATARLVGVLPPKNVEWWTDDNKGRIKPVWRPEFKDDKSK